jgi:hypothetical protein
MPTSCPWLSLSGQPVRIHGTQESQKEPVPPERIRCCTSCGDKKCTNQLLPSIYQGDGEVDGSGGGQILAYCFRCAQGRGMLREACQIECTDKDKSERAYFKREQKKRWQKRLTLKTNIKKWRRANNFQVARADQGYTEALPTPFWRAAEDTVKLAAMERMKAKMMAVDINRTIAARRAEGVAAMTEFANHWHANKEDTSSWPNNKNATIPAYPAEATPAADMPASNSNPTTA